VVWHQLQQQQLLLLLAGVVAAAATAMHMVWWVEGGEVAWPQLQRWVQLAAAVQQQLCQQWAAARGGSAEPPSRQL
jgi:hypothetical protein